jgi:hypothetical protein
MPTTRRAILRLDHGGNVLVPGLGVLPTQQ